MLSVTAKNLLVKLGENVEELDNGLSIDSRVSNRRKIVSGVIELAGKDVVDMEVGNIVYFPLYAADEISIAGETKYILTSEDVKIVEKIK